MKKVITSLALFLLPALALTGGLQAQQFPSPSMASFTKTSHSLTTSGNSNPKSTKEMKKAARESRQFSRVTQAFEQAYPGATFISWTRQNNAYAGTFTQNGLKHLVWFRTDGSLINSMVTYGAQHLPEDVSKLVKSSYKDYTISLVNEVHQDDIVVYLVTLENEKFIKQVTVCEGDINLYKSYRKA